MPAAVLSVADCVKLVRDRAGPSQLLVSGGEPTLRPDLPRLLRALVDAAPTGSVVGLRTDGLALAVPGVVASLQASGLHFLQVVLFAARPRAQDALVGVEGHGVAALRGLRAAAEGGLTVRVELPLTRPGAPLLAESVSLLGELGVRTVMVRPLRALGWFADHFAAYSARLGLLASSLQAALREAGRLGVTLEGEGLPRCFTPPGMVAHVPRAEPRPRDVGGRCAACDPTLCDGVSADYVAAFGWDELAPPGEPAALPMVRETLRGPSHHACATCADEEGATPESWCAEPSRPARVRLLRAASRRPARLRLASTASLHHPRAAELLGELVRLDGPAIEVAGDLAPVAAWSDDELHRVRKVARVDAALFGPDAARHDAHVGRPGAFAASLVALTRFPDSVATGVYAVLHDEEPVRAYASAWARGELPGVPAFRLSPRGASLDALAAAAHGLPPSAASAALCALLPACLRGDDAPPASLESGDWTLDGPDRGGAAPSATDRWGTHTPCPQVECGSRAGCAGVPTGWSLRGVTAPRSAGGTP